ncbi:MAG: threonine--tRNA ligase [Clostridiales bacterium]|nr:threonine--tRNA ligase [Clostridiales bacterium]
MKLTLSGKTYDVEQGTPAGELIKNEFAEDFKKYYAVKLADGTLTDLFAPINTDNEITPVTFEDEDGKKVLRHSCSHLMSMAVQQLYPEAKLAIGPAIENGFYYDFDVETPFTPDDLPEIEKAMDKLMRMSIRPKRFTLPRTEAIAFMKEKNEPYKVELIEDLPEDAEISFYQMGDFVDLCAGPHLPNLNYVKAFKLTQIAGAYWRGDEKNKMLSRIYGTCFPTKPELAEYLAQVEEARKRDHNKLGRELELFTTAEIIGQGLPIFLPKGTRILQILQRWVEDTEMKRGYMHTKTPLLAKRDLYKISGHWDHYRDGMFIIGDPDDEERECFALRPMTCPFQYQAFLNRSRSYRDLPMRLGETSTLFRNEDSGEMHGLIRVRQFTISEAHLIITPDQLEEEFRGCFNLAHDILSTLGLWEGCTFQFSKWDPENKNNKYEGTPEQWEFSQNAMQVILDDIGIDYKTADDDAAFYGPKLDIQIKNVFGKEDTLITIQIDILLAKKFGMEYTDADGQKKNPFIIHRTSIGCYERTLALLIEKYAGAFPTWLSPVQVKILTITNRSDGAAGELQRMLLEQNLRCELDLRNEKIGFKVREAQLKKIPYMFVLGDREAEDKTVTIRGRKGDSLGTVPFTEAVAMIKKLNDDKTID